MRSTSFGCYVQTPSSHLKHQPTNLPNLMATPKAREGSNLKERERKNSAPSSLQSTSSNEIRSPRPTTPDSHKQQQQTLNNVKLKSTVAPVIAPKFTTSKRLPLQKSPTPTPKSRTALPSAPMLIKEGPPVRLPYAAPRQFASLKPSWPEKVSKSSASSSPAKTGQVARARAVDSRREVVVPSTSAAADKKTEILDSGREALATQKDHIKEQKEEDIIIDSSEKKEQDPVDESTPTAEAHLMEHPQFQLNSKDNYSTTQTEEKKAEATNESTPQVEEEKAVEEVSTDGSNVEEGRKIQTSTKPTTPRRGHRGLPAAEPAAAEEAKPAKIRAAMDASKRNTEAVKKETVRSNDVIEEAKSKLLEKRKNKVLALVGAFETVMALQEPDGQQTSKAKEEDAESSSIE